jgi:hypothetical protein
MLDEVSGGQDRLQARDGTYDLTVEALAAALELRDDETGQHTRRVTDLALALTRAVDPDLARDPELRYGFPARHRQDRRGPAIRPGHRGSIHADRRRLESANRSRSPTPRCSG